MTSAHNTGSLRRSVTNATRANKSLDARDRAAINLALAYADAIDEALVSNDPMLKTKTLYLGPHLLATLTALGCTPAGRKDVETSLKGAKVESGLDKFGGMKLVQ